MPKTAATLGDKPDTQKVLAGLKEFQLRSVEYVFSRLFGSDGTRKFLLAERAQGLLEKGSE